MAYIAFNLSEEHLRSRTAVPDFRGTSIFALKVFNVCKPGREVDIPGVTNVMYHDHSFVMYSVATKGNNTHSKEIYDIVHESELPTIFVGRSEDYFDDIYTFLRELHLPVQNMSRVGVSFYEEGMTIAGMIAKTAVKPIYHPASAIKIPFPTTDQRLNFILGSVKFMYKLYKSLGFDKAGVDVPTNLEEDDKLAFTPYVSIILFIIDGYRIKPRGIVNNAEYSMQYDSDYRNAVFNMLEIIYDTFFRKQVKCQS